MHALTLLQTLLDQVPPRLEKIPSSQAEFKPVASEWSPKQELGHRLDSAANHRQRIVRAQLEDKPAMPGYDGERWAELHRYQHRDWHELIELWKALHRQLLAAAQPVPGSVWPRTSTLADSEPLTLKFVFADYLEPRMHDLQHIGILVKDLKGSHQPRRADDWQLSTDH